MFGVSGRGVGGCRLGRSGLRVEIKDLGVMRSFDVAGLGSSCRAKDGLKPGEHGGKVKEGETVQGMDVCLSTREDGDMGVDGPGVVRMKGSWGTRR